MLVKGLFLSLRENLVQLPHFAEGGPKIQRGKIACSHAIKFTRKCICGGETRSPDFQSGVLFTKQGHFSLQLPWMFPAWLIRQDLSAYRQMVWSLASSFFSASGSHDWILWKWMLSFITGCLGWGDVFSQMTPHMVCDEVGFSALSLCRHQMAALNIDKGCAW